MVIHKYVFLVGECQLELFLCTQDRSDIVLKLVVKRDIVLTVNCDKTLGGNPVRKHFFKFCYYVAGS